LYFFDGAVTTPIEEACRIGIIGISLHGNYLRYTAAGGSRRDPG